VIDYTARTDFWNQVENIMHENKFANPWQTISTAEKYDNPWITVTESQVIRPDGQPGIYGVVHFKNKAIGILPVDEEGCLYLVGQFRYAINRYSWEIPEGGGPEDESPLESAKRELLEETGLSAARWKLLGRSHLSNCVCDEDAYYFLATELTQGEASPEGTEKLELRRVHMAEALEMISRQEITDSLTIIAIFHYLYFQKLSSSASD
jgi:8-oxo-dGTP pyrophosphatase MutT (NUDIX family)